MHGGAPHPRGLNPHPSITALFSTAQEPRHFAWLQSRTPIPALLHSPASPSSLAASSLSQHSVEDRGRASRRQRAESRGWRVPPVLPRSPPYRGRLCSSLSIWAWVPGEVVTVWEVVAMASRSPPPPSCLCSQGVSHWPASAHYGSVSSSGRDSGSWGDGFASPSSTKPPTIPAMDPHQTSPRTAPRTLGWPHHPTCTPQSALPQGGQQKASRQRGHTFLSQEHPGRAGPAPRGSQPWALSGKTEPTALGWCRGYPCRQMGSKSSPSLRALAPHPEGHRPHCSRKVGCPWPYCTGLEVIIMLTT